MATTKYVHAWRGRIRAKLQETLDDIDRIIQYGEQHSGMTPPFFGSAQDQANLQTVLDWMITKLQEMKSK